MNRPFGDKSAIAPANLISAIGCASAGVRGRKKTLATALGGNSKPASQVPSAVIDVDHRGIALVDSRSTVPVPSAACLYTLGMPVRPDSKMICRLSGVQTDIPLPLESKVRCLSVFRAKSQIQTSVICS